MTVNNKYKSNNTNSLANILITGGNGDIGKYLYSMLLDKGYAVATIGRKTNPKNDYFWDIKNQEIEDGALQNADYIIHLAGAGIADKRWTIERKIEILDSRVKSTKLLYNNIADSNLNIKAFISASAVGYYGAITSDTIFDEKDAPAIDFLGTICSKWEEEINEFTKLNIRPVSLRTGVVLMQSGGALEKIVAPIKMGVGSSLGSGKQFMPWIHITDLCNMYIKAIEEPQMLNAYNAVAPEFLTYNEFGKTVAKILKRPYFFPKIPAFILRLVMGQMSDILLKGSRVSSEKIVSEGFDFEYPKLENALKNILK